MDFGIRLRLVLGRGLGHSPSRSGSDQRSEAKLGRDTVRSASKKDDRSGRMPEDRVREAKAVWLALRTAREDWPYSPPNGTCRRQSAAFCTRDTDLPSRGTCVRTWSHRSARFGEVILLIILLLILLFLRQTGTPAPTSRPRPRAGHADTRSTRRDSEGVGGRREGWRRDTMYVCTSVRLDSTHHLNTNIRREPAKWSIEISNACVLLSLYGCEVLLRFGHPFDRVNRVTLCPTYAPNPLLTRHYQWHRTVSTHEFYRQTASNDVGERLTRTHGDLLLPQVFIRIGQRPQHRARRTLVLIHPRIHRASAQTRTETLLDPGNRAPQVPSRDRQPPTFPETP
jgi:hypothetical protein